MSKHSGVSTLSTWLVVLALSGWLAACAGNTDLLPHSVYYLCCSLENYQVWRMAVDGTTTIQLTDDTFRVDEFSVSGADGSLVFITNNQLILVNPGLTN